MRRAHGPRLLLHGAQGALPLWYIQHRVHAHTRLRIVGGRFILNKQLVTGSCYGRSTLPLVVPPSVGGLTVEIGSLPPGTTPTSATEVVSGKRLDIVPSPPITGRWAIALPDLRIVAALKIKLSVNS